MTIEKTPQGNRHRSGKPTGAGSGKLQAMDDQTAAAKNSRHMWIFLAVMLIVMVLAFSSPLLPSGNRDRPPTDAEKCAGLTGPECLEKLSLERRRREFVESPAGQEFLRAADATSPLEK